MSAVSRRARIAELNDQLRARAGFPVLNATDAPKGLIVTTCGVLGLSQAERLIVFRAVRRFADFSEDNDPHGEHDFGAIDVADVGRVFWKIDYYADATCRFGSEDPSDPEQCFRVLTVMLAEEY
jgi:hypothetical protein